MTKRSPLVVVLLSLCTFTLYAYYWLYKSTEELREETGRNDLSPLLDVFLTLATFGLWGLYAAYRNAKIVHEEMELRGQVHTDRSVGVAVFGALTTVSGWAWLVSMALLQEDYNRLADVELDYFASVEPAAKLRVEVEPMDRVQPASESRWGEAPAAPIFRSSAPMPVVF